MVVEDVRAGPTAIGERTRRRTSIVRGWLVPSRKGSTVSAAPRSRLRKSAARWPESDWFMPVLLTLLALIIGAILLVVQWLNPGLIPFTGTHWS